MPRGDAALGSRTSMTSLPDRLHERARILHHNVQELECILSNGRSALTQPEIDSVVAMRDGAASCRDLLLEAFVGLDAGSASPTLRVDFHRPVASKKNSKERKFKRRADGSRYSYTGRSKKAQNDEETLQLVALAAARAQDWKLLEEDEVELRVVWNVEGGLALEVRSIGPKPKAPRTGRSRDLVGMLETIADALQRVAYRDDAQIARVVLERHIPSAPIARNVPR